MSTPTHPFDQPTREMLIGSFLDISFEEIDAGIKGFDDEVVAALEANHQADLLVQVHQSLEVGPHHDGFDEARMQYLQALTMMSDQTLLMFVQAFGHSPYTESGTDR